MLKHWRAGIHRNNARQNIALSLWNTTMLMALASVGLLIAHWCGYNVSAQIHGYSLRTWVFAATLTWCALLVLLKFYVKNHTQPPKMEWHDGLMAIIPLLIIAGVFSKLTGRR